MNPVPSILTWLQPLGKLFELGKVEWDAVANYDTTLKVETVIAIQILNVRRASDRSRLVWAGICEGATYRKWPLIGVGRD